MARLLRGEGGKGVHHIKKAPPLRRCLSCNKRIPGLLDLGFLELDVLARHRVILLEGELVGLGARVLLGDVEVARVSRRLQLDLDYIALGHNKSPRDPSGPGFSWRGVWPKGG